MIILVNSLSSDACTTNEDCQELNYCDLKVKKCVHAKIFTDFPKELMGLVFIVFGSALSNAGGIGGGGLFVPVCRISFLFFW